MNELITISPIDGRELLRRPYTSETDIARALRTARRAQHEWARVPLAQRCALVSACVDAVVARSDAMAQSITEQMGRPIRYTPGELRGFEDRARHMIAIAPEALAPIYPAKQDKLDRYILREPVGTVLTVAPWNYPLLTAVNSIVPALVAGNSVILKHSDQTPLCAEQLVEAFSAAGLPEGLFQYIHATHDTIRQIIQSPYIDYVSFTGSVRGGTAIEEAATGRFIGKGLELGGNDPAYVRADADLGHAVDTLVDGAFFNSGQSCCGIQRIYVDQAIYQDFIDRAVALTETYVLDDPMNPNTTLGPVVRAKSANEIRQTLDQALNRGARNLIDSGKFARAQPGSTYVAPALLTDVNHDMLVMNEECFGPVVGIMAVPSDQRAIELMNDSNYGLTASVFTQDADAAVRIGSQVQTGTFFMNRCDYLDPALAWTGVKNTGHGISLSTLGYQALTRAKSFHLRQL
ncbi:aldehyde dehydrogenase family protein [Pusillimonas sp. ANT_WB101]|uniref:aldehyde dehydrogenase family protein n=1 Tax=Pusillimonas sp. ANT_WB101 TaxID=2597356 RepID=UPI0011EECAB6|nr:aldehyde dehydrogenase family protein [Pusillimonas sp. ANT_WB101]KAA0893056.1 aldehyde dehydrogenase family protein [Pusillimonas sp. ANT_WB101]